MTNAYTKLAKIIGTNPLTMEDLDQKMIQVTGKASTLDSVLAKNDTAVDKILVELSLTRESKAEEVYKALADRLTKLDNQLFDFLDKPDLSKMSLVCGKLCEVALRVFQPPKGLFIKKEKVTELLAKYPPQDLMDHLRYSSVDEMVEKEGFASVVGALRFTQSKEWMHKFFDQAYSELKAEDFEEREVELKILETKWLGVAEKFLEKKYHNVSHLKEYGVIFVIPLKIDTPGEMTRLFTLILHYLHEVPFYAGLIRRFINDSDFADKFKSLLRGDVTEGALPEGGTMTWRVVQRYLAKDDKNDSRLIEPHVNPEADHWYRAEEDLVKLSNMSGDSNNIGLGFWSGLDFVAEFFKDANGNDKLISFDLIDLIMSVVSGEQDKHMYHQKEALWNKIFIEYMGREKMNTLIEENIIKGYITL